VRTLRQQPPIFHLELDHTLRLLGRVVGERHREVDREPPHLRGAVL
jgi:hypothetical protein